MKIFAIGRNYIDHAKELNNPVPIEPVVFMKPHTALLKKNIPFYYPKFSNDIHFEVEVVIKISKNGKHIQPQFAKNYFEEIGLGIDFTARDIQAQCKAKSLPWEKAKAFDGSAVIGTEFIPKEELDNNFDFSLTQNDILVQSGNTKDMIFDFEYLICHLSQYFTLQKGDLIYTGTPKGVGPIQIGDKLIGKIGTTEFFNFEIK